MGSLAPTTATMPGPTVLPAARYLGAQVVGSFGLAAGGTSGGLLAADLTGHTAAGALPIGFLALGAALSAPALTAVMARSGRRAGLVAGYLGAAVGAAVVVLGTAVGSLLLVVGGSAALGSGNSAVMLTRYVLADAVGVAERGRAVSRSLLASIAGAIIGPNLLRPAAALASPLDLPAAAGLYFVAVAAFLVAAGILQRGPAAPRPVARPGQRTDPGVASPASRTRAGVAAGRQAIVVLATANAAMVSMMSIATVHLGRHGHHGHDLGAIGLAVSLHVAGMFVGSPLVGWLCDRLGARWVAVGGATLLTVVGAGGALAETGSIVTLGGVLLVLGVSWNLQVVAGTVMLTDATPVPLRPAAEGRGEMLMGVAAGAGTLLAASPLAALGGFRLVSTAVAVVGAVTVGQLARSLLPRRPTAPAVWARNAG
jgi:MFS family permease